VGQVAPLGTDYKKSISKCGEMILGSRVAQRAVLVSILTVFEA
jgi:hypothetical protein